MTRLFLPCNVTTMWPWKRIPVTDTAMMSYDTVVFPYARGLYDMIAQPGHITRATLQPYFDKMKAFDVREFECKYVPLKHATLDPRERTIVNETLSKFKPWQRDLALERLSYEDMQFTRGYLLYHAMQIPASATCPRSKAWVDVHVEYWGLGCVGQGTRAKGECINRMQRHRDLIRKVDWIKLLCDLKMPSKTTTRLGRLQLRRRRPAKPRVV